MRKRTYGGKAENVGRGEAQRNGGKAEDVGRGKAQRTGAAKWVLLPYVLFLAAPLLGNRVAPTVGGLPFLFFWMLLATLLTPLAVWLARRGDLRRAKAQASAPADERGRG